LAELEGAALDVVDDLAHRALAVDGLEHGALLNGELRLVGDALGRARISVEHLAEIEAALDEPPLVDAPEALHHQAADAEAELGLGGCGHRRIELEAEAPLVPADQLVDHLFGLGGE